MVGRKKMSWYRQLAALIIVLALAGCPSVTTGPEQGQNPSYPQSEPRDTSGMH